jgi:hypothetical protein
LDFGYWLFLGLCLLNIQYPCFRDIGIALVLQLRPACFSSYIHEWNALGFYKIGSRSPIWLIAPLFLRNLGPDFADFYSGFFENYSVSFVGLGSVFGDYWVLYSESLV